MEGEALQFLHSLNVYSEHGRQLSNSAWISNYRLQRRNGAVKAPTKDESVNVALEAVRCKCTRRWMLDTLWTSRLWSSLPYDEKLSYPMAWHRDKDQFWFQCRQLTKEIAEEKTAERSGWHWCSRRNWKSTSDTNSNSCWFWFQALEWVRGTCRLGPFVISH